MRTHDPVGYFVAEAFARKGIYAEVMQVGTQFYVFAILPPYISLYWDDYYKTSFLGPKTMGAINITPGRSAVMDLFDNPGSKIPASVLNEQNILSTATQEESDLLVATGAVGDYNDEVYGAVGATRTVRQELNAVGAWFRKFIGSTKYAGGYVGGITIGLSD